MLCPERPDRSVTGSVAVIFHNKVARSKHFSVPQFLLLCVRHLTSRREGRGDTWLLSCFAARLSLLAVLGCCYFCWRGAILIWHPV